MRIAYVSTLLSAAWGGSEELWAQSAREAVELDHQIGIFVYDWPGLPPQISELASKGASVFKRPRRISFVRRYLRRGFNKFLKKDPLFFNPYSSLLQFKPDVVVVTDGSTYYAANSPDLSSLLLNKFKGKYVIVSQANTDYHLPDDRAHAFQFFENALRVFFVSEQNRRLAFHQLAGKLTRSEVIQNPVLLKSFEQMPLPPMNGTIHCAVVGRFCISDKGQDILISMMSDPYWDNVNIKLHLYGKGQDRDYLQQLIIFYGLTEKITIEGFVEDRTEMWKECHCLMMCSHIEGTPLSLLEAMIMGRVCIVSRAGGNEEWIEDGVNGFLVEAPAKDLFLQKMKEALSRTDDWKAISDRAHSNAMQRLDTNPGRTMLQRIEKLTRI